MLVAIFGRMEAAIPIYPYQPINWQWILSQEGEDKIVADTRAAIVPHDAVSHKELTQFYRGLAKANPNVEMVVVIGPNHNEKGTANIQADSRSFQTVDGLLPVNWQLADHLRSSGVGAIESATFVKEHAVTMQVEYIKRFFPKAKFLPIVLKSEVTPREIDGLVLWLTNELAPEKTLVIGSIDFSHYLTKAQADKNDAKTLHQIESMDLNVLPTKDAKCEFLDSPMSLRAVVQYARAVAATKPTVVRHDNSADILGNPGLASTTSHFYMTFGG